MARQPADQVFVVRCECGFEARGSLKKITPIMQKHGRDAHNMKASPGEVAARARPV